LINFASYEQIDNCPKKGHKKIPPNLKTNSEGNLGYNKITHPNIVFFGALNYRVGGPMSILWTQKVEHFLSA
jgi:hypothetical protein